jgi:GntR family transcriptional regulator/MocR family aminotransferase
LPDRLDEDAVVDRAAADGVRVYALGRYRVSPAAEPTVFSPALVIGFGNVNESRIRRGVRVLAGALAD